MSNGYAFLIKQADLKALIRNASKNPVRVCMADGVSYKIAHEDFALPSEDTLLLVSGPGHEFGASYVFCPYDQIARVEVMKKNGRSK